MGKAYHGWQNQPNAITVQEVLEDAISKLLHQDISLVGAGRTDSGVHAKQMFAHFDSLELMDIPNIMYRLNAFLPNDIAVQHMYAVQGSAHARFDAISRTYQYWVVQHKNPFLQDFAHFIKHALDIGKMNDAAALFLKEKDFECFSKSNTDVHTYYCNVQEAYWSLEGNRLVFTIRADRFLRNMVRAMVGTLLDVGTGKSDIADVNTILKSKDRAKAGPSVPAKGLYLTAIMYPESVFI